MKLSYLQQGFGTSLPLVLLHPFPLNSRFWSNQLSGLSHSSHVVAPDFRGYGASTSENLENISIAAFATDIRKTLKGAKISKAIFAGCSMGGYVLFELWRQDPALIAGMAFIDTRAEADTEEARAKRMELIEKIKLSGTADLPDMAAGYMSQATRDTRPAVERDVRSWAQKPSCEVIIRTLEMLARRPDSVATLATITVPTIAIVGEEDKVTPVDAARVIADGVEDARLVTVPGAGHLSPLEDPKAVNAALASLIAEVTA